MAYKKPQMVAKSSAKKSYVAGCPVNSVCNLGCNCLNTACMMGKLD